MLPVINGNLERNNYKRRDQLALTEGNSMKTKKNETETSQQYNVEVKLGVSFFMPAHLIKVAVFIVY